METARLRWLDSLSAAVESCLLPLQHLADPFAVNGFTAATKFSVSAPLLLTSCAAELSFLRASTVFHSS